MCYNNIQHSITLTIFLETLTAEDILELEKEEDKEWIFERAWKKMNKINYHHNQHREMKRSARLDKQIYQVKMLNEP